MCLYFLISVSDRQAGSNRLDLQISRYRDYLISVVEPINGISSIYPYILLVILLVTPLVTPLYPPCILLVSSFYPPYTLLILQR